MEAQMEAAAEHAPARKAPLTAEEAERLRRKENLLLSRKHLVQEIAATQNVRRREMLEQALTYLDEQLAEAD